MHALPQASSSCERYKKWAAHYRENPAIALEAIKDKAGLLSSLVEAPATHLLWCILNTQPAGRPLPGEVLTHEWLTMTPPPSTTPLVRLSEVDTLEKRREKRKRFSASVMAMDSEEVRCRLGPNVDAEVA